MGATARSLAVVGIVLLAGPVGARPGPAEPGDWLVFREAPPLEREAPAPRRRWAIQFGRAAILDNTSYGLLQGEADDADGDEGGWIDHVGAALVLHDFEWGERPWRPSLELPFSVSRIDERGRSPFLAARVGVAFRWRDFPWNDSLRTSVAVGLGAAYFERILLVDVKRHPGEDRANLKFHSYLEISFALPSHPQHEIVLFNDHWSGAHLTDEGGIDAFGIAYRYWF